jgi:hypothetical protein
MITEILARAIQLIVADISIYTCNMLGSIATRSRSYQQISTTSLSIPNHCSLTSTSRTTAYDNKPPGFDRKELKQGSLASLSLIGLHACCASAVDVQYYGPSADLTAKLHAGSLVWEYIAWPLPLRFLRRTKSQLQMNYRVKAPGCMPVAK